MMQEVLIRECTNKYIAVYLEDEWSFRGQLVSIVDNAVDTPVVILESNNGAKMFIPITEIRAVTLSSNPNRDYNKPSQKVPAKYSPDRRPIRT